jgi:hypothetical protein
VARSVGAVALGFVAIFVLSLGTDQVFHSLGVYPAWGQPMRETSLNFLALSYRLVYDALGPYLSARFAPRNPMRHAMVLGGIGLVLSSLGAIAAIQTDLGPAWYPIALALSALPSAWLGGALHRASRSPFSEFALSADHDRARKCAACGRWTSARPGWSVQGPATCRQCGGELGRS